VAIRILCVSEDDSILQLASMHLPLRGFEVETSTDGRMALTRIEDEPFDLVLLDIDSPVTYGLDILRCIQLCDIDVVPLVLTSADDLWALRECADWGTSDYLLKPFTLAELLDAVDRALAETVSVYRL
jgi:two-component system, OmpR family, response regulator